MKWIILSLIALAVGSFAWFVWPTQYEYTINKVRREELVKSDRHPNYDKVLQREETVVIVRDRITGRVHQYTLQQN